jgi:hypothetical protein
LGPDLRHGLKDSFSIRHVHRTHKRLSPLGPNLSRNRLARL